MSVRTDQLPRDPSFLAEQVAKLRRDLDELRATAGDMAAADSLLAPHDLDPARWPQTDQAAWTAIARSNNLRWKSQLRVILATAVSGTAVGDIRLTIDGAQWGPTVAAGDSLDHTEDLPAIIPIGGQWRLDIEGQRTSGTGSVHAQIQLIRVIT
ncbi:hypothetical protein ABZY44_23945 [Streptomyces sp. NPDC006544]|uniref:hypothetical protein n=1 Tax=Streptomyces sp. NPDC006544 TaxID=3154583 RepID=UPI0033B7007C